MAGIVLIFGATSPIARAAAAEFARGGHGLVLLGRDSSELNRIGDDLRIRYGVHVRTDRFEACSISTCRNAVDRAFADNDVEGVLWAVGETPQTPPHMMSRQDLLRIMHVNFVAATDVLSVGAAHLDRRKNGFIIAIGSVAGDRGRCGNYPYGAAKAGLATFMEGLRCRLNSHGVRVVTVKLGLVDTRSTFGARPTPFVASPAVVGSAIARSSRRGPLVQYLPWYWRWIMVVVRKLPTQVISNMGL